MWKILILGFVFFQYASQIACCQDDSITAAKAAWQNKVEQLTRLTVDYSFKVQRFPAEEENSDIKLDDGASISIRTENTHGTGGIWRDGKQWRVYRNLDDSLDINNNIYYKKYIASNSTNRYEKLYIFSGDKQIRGSISDLPDLPDEQHFNIAIGFKLLREKEWIDKEFIQACEGLNNADGSVSLVHKPKDSHKRYIFKFSPVDNYALISCEGFSPKGMKFFSANMEDFIDVQSYYLPQSATITFFRMDGTIRDEFTYAVSRYNTNEEHNFLINWPIGAIVADARTGANVEIKTRPQRLDEAILEEAKKEIDQKIKKPLRNTSPLSDSTAQFRWIFIISINIILVLVLLVFGIRKKLKK